MLKKIISGGQTGADRAALDTAIKFNIDHGGFIPAGRRAEDGLISYQYNLTEINSGSYPKRTEQNIINSDGTVIISHGELTGGSLLTKKIASRLKKPWCHIDLMEIDEFEGAVALHEFVDVNQIEILNVAGPRASQDSFIYRSAKSIIETFIYMELMESEPEELKREDIILFNREPEIFCATIEDAIKFLADTMHLRTRSIIANSSESEVKSLYFSLFDIIKVKLGLDFGNNELLENCRKRLAAWHEYEFKQYKDSWNNLSGTSGTDDIEHKLDIEDRLDCSLSAMDIEDAAMVILKELRQFLKQSHVLRVIK